jgi:arginine/serine-rich splicing factor 4/5/6
MSRKVYIGRLNDQVRERDVERFFKGFHVRDIMLKNGYGFVEFDDPRDADDAVYELNGKDLLGDRIIVEHARGPSRRGVGGFGFAGRDSKPVWVDKYGPPVRTPYRVIVENLSSRVSWQLN